MFSNQRNPSPPADDEDLLRNMSILYLMPALNAAAYLNFDIDLFHPGMFVSPPESDNERESNEKEVEHVEVHASVTPPVSPGNHQVIPEKEISSVEAPERREETTKSKHIKIKSRKHHKLERGTTTEIHDDRVPKRWEKITIEKESECNRSKPKTEIHDDQVPKRWEKITIEKESELNRCKSKTEIHDDQVQKRWEKIKEEKESEYYRSKPRRYRESEQVTKVIKKEHFAEDDWRRHHKSSKHKKDRSPCSACDSDEYDYSKPKKKHKRHSRHTSISGSEDSNSNLQDSPRLTSKTYRRRKNSMDDDYFDNKFNSRSARHLRDVWDSDQSNSRGSDGCSKFYKKDASDSERTNSRRQDLSYKTFKTEPADGFSSSESKYMPQFGYTPEPSDGAQFGPDSFYCSICQLDLNGFTPYQSHIKGKKHLKALRAQMPPDDVKIRPTNYAALKDSIQSSDYKPQPILSNMSQLESTLVNYGQDPILGLDYIQENHTDKDVSYYCCLCEAKCMNSSILPHIIGFKHQKNILKKFDPLFYSRIQNYSKKDINNRLIQRMFELERQFGRGKVQVVVSNSQNECLPYADAGQSRADVVNEALEEIKYYSSQPEESFQTLPNDFHCKICDAHMNTANMLAAHIAGKRHLKNEKKMTAGEGSAQKGTRAPRGTPSTLEKAVALNTQDVIVGLDFIREVQSGGTGLYTCYLCGCSAGLDMIDHLLTLKHRVKFLEAVNESGKMPNSIKSINKLEFNPMVRETLVLEQCEKMEKQYGRGKVEVYLSHF